jgi:putative membrane protein
VGDITGLPPLSVVLGLIALQALYLACIGPWRNRFPGSAQVGMGKRALFAQGVVVLFLVLASPVHVIAERYLFTGHMLQHLAITFVAAPLLLAGTPGWLLEDVLRSTHLLPAARFVRQPLVAYMAFNVTFSFAHVPGIYELALSSEPLHAVEHLLFLLGALILWLPILSPLPTLLPRYPYPGQILYLFLQTVPQMLLGALLSISGAPIYPTYALAPRLFDWLDPLMDQQLGGLIMWVGGSTYFLGATAIVFFRWAAIEERAEPHPPAGGRPAGGSSVRAQASTQSLYARDNLGGASWEPLP